MSVGETANNYIWGLFLSPLPAIAAYCGELPPHLSAIKPLGVSFFSG
ncbi:hypothetical protein YPPY66_0925 [Yersinia pestis PY-66]|uniref:Uncharacterized protein n=1 Tax=Yersinia pestis PY-08 TaxID=992134 RepID=A0AB72ZPR0_YERPE|nr:hypothetical protein YPPY01_0740 [Yersinia pestis PY-01]EIQ94238.1 hypothetical protein YPPY02_0765 [Yersinia pestis PY-02]EIR07611.1 hypothetical protein YPPY04_0841 [Yersinia pestis PY-04]EIR08519.1 hypothetical protein YPPY05_0780 [Yersinia pestis PY-05]EIR22403.1 hypothetical protein YPPY07_0675 [Yersinia pestis PY-07]EIR23663.1 hypothetical protein YPPY08_0848 [Yersinia pestis PY-08]EIR37402.1 hypothetical protein YPPY10_0841 [Yersinia pestis PY-10]EIR38197.1 hypothetical protein YPP